ncbi:unnamed protein product, partial [Mesorhabditis spiculigera]
MLLCSFLLLLLPAFAYIPKKTAPQKVERKMYRAQIPVDDLAGCPFCNLERCGSMGFCYVEKHRLEGE